MHFLYPDGSVFGEYRTQPNQVSEPTAEAAQTELATRHHAGLLMWIDFAKTEITGSVDTARGKRYATIRHKVGELVIATDTGKLRPYSEVLTDECEPNAYIKMWLGCYAMDRAKNSFGYDRHPLFDVYELYTKAGIEQGLAETQARAKRENWNPRINVRAWYVASLLAIAKREYAQDGNDMVLPDCSALLRSAAAACSE